MAGACCMIQIERRLLCDPDGGHHSRSAPWRSSARASFGRDPDGARLEIGASFGRDPGYDPRWRPDGIGIQIGACVIQIGRDPGYRSGIISGGIRGGQNRVQNRRVYITRIIGRSNGVFGRVFCNGIG